MQMRRLIHSLCQSFSSVYVKAPIFSSYVNLITGGGDEYPVIWFDNTRWRAFWWFKKDSEWPKLKDDVLGGTIDIFSVSAN